MSAPSSLLRSAPHSVPKVALPSIAPCYRVRQPAACPVTRTSRTLATVNPGQKALPDVWFTGSTPRHNIPNPPGSDPQKPPDERTVKLGKSKHTPHFPTTPANITKSTPNPPGTTPNPPTIPPTARYPLSTNNPPPLPLNPPSPPHRLRPRRILRRSLDLSYCMGSRAARGERKARDPLRAHGQVLLTHTIRSHSSRTADRTVADNWKNERQRNGRIL
jgi:hypothetical protein